MDTVEIKNRIIEKADHLFKTQGYEETGMRDIAKACGISLGKVQYYFPKKSLIMEEVYNMVISEYFLQQSHVEISDQSPLVGIMASEYEFILRAMQSEGARKSYMDSLGNPEICTVYVEKSTQLIVEKSVFPQQKRIDIFIANVMMYGGLHQILQFYVNRSAEYALEDLMHPLFKSRLLLLGMADCDGIITDGIRQGKQLAAIPRA